MDRESLLQAVQVALGEAARVEGRIGGGDQAQAATLITESRKRYFFKWAESGPLDWFEAEAHGLRALEAAGAPVPRTIAVGKRFLVLELIREGRRSREYWAQLGRALAALQRCSAQSFGFDRHNYCGASMQPNPWTSNWPQFFADHRLRHQLRLLRQSGVSHPALERAVQAVAARIDSEGLGEAEPPALVHGDLWSGNVMVGAAGCPVFVDPAAHFAHREVDLAMSELFGGFSPEFYAAYREVWPLAPGYPERRDIYNLYHLLNHATLFGGGWVGRAAQAAARLVVRRRNNVAIAGGPFAAGTGRAK